MENNKNNKLITAEKDLENTNRLIKKAKKHIIMGKTLLALGSGMLGYDLAMLTNENNRLFYVILSALWLFVIVDNYRELGDRKRILENLIESKKYYEREIAELINNEEDKTSKETLNDSFVHIHK